MYIVTHTAPDLDAVGSCWLLQRFGGFEAARVVFVNTGAPDADLITNAAAVVDTGREHDPTRNCFDHHQDASLRSAAALVFDALLGTDRSEEDALLPAAEIVSLIDVGDRGLPDAAQSRQIGLHAIFSGGRPDGDDAGSMAYGYALLDALYLTAKRRSEGRAALASCVVYRSTDGLLVALKDAPRAATSAAFEQGARLVLFADYATNAIGIQRAAEWATPHVGDLVETVIELSDTAGPIIRTELESWYRHPAGFFAGRGTAKAPREDAIPVHLAELAHQVDMWWQR